MPLRNLSTGLPPSIGLKTVLSRRFSRPSPVFADSGSSSCGRTPALRGGASPAVMSGSGSSLFGLFRDAGTAFRVAEGFREKDVAAYSHAL